MHQWYHHSHRDGRLHIIRASPVEEPSEDGASEKPLELTGDWRQFRANLIAKDGGKPTYTDDGWPNGYALIFYGRMFK
jgi:hypothetical protein